jgi:hypothetical protein
MTRFADGWQWIAGILLADRLCSNFYPGRAIVAKNLFECEFPPCQNPATPQSISPFSDAPPLTVKLCDAHLDDVLNRTMLKEFVDWLISRQWP